MSCQVEQIADCSDILSLARALFISDREDVNWLSQCCISVSSCGNLMAVSYRKRLCLLTAQWISSTDTNTFLISWSGSLPAEATYVLALPICPTKQSSQSGPDWFCIIVGFDNGSVGFYTNTGHLLLLEKLDEKPVVKISCHTGTYGTLQDDIHILFKNSECILSGVSLFQTLRSAKSQLARVQAGLQSDYSVDSRNVAIRKWTFSDQEDINDASVVGLELKNTYDHLLAASTYGGYDTWYRSIPPVNTLILGAGSTPYVGFHYALEGGTTPPLQDVARAVANKIKSALPGWLGGGNQESAATNSEPSIRSESLIMRAGLYDAGRLGAAVHVSPDRRLAAVADSAGRVAVLDVAKGHLIRLFKGCRDAQCAFVQIFEDNKKPQLSIVKELRRAIFLIIYNPKKGLVDIRLMHRGNRVAVFTATKNGRLIYNTSGLVGAEKNYTHKRINLPDFQCILIDPDGKLKRFNIPFFYALEGEHSDKSKDLHILRELRECMKRSPFTTEDEEELIKKASTLNTLEVKKHCIDLMLRYQIAPKVVMACLEIFWDSLSEKLNDRDEKVKVYFANIALITLFYRQINNENVDDMKQLIDKVKKLEQSHSIAEEEDSIEPENETQISEFHLVEDDSCILERLLQLAEELNYKEHHHNRVKFAELNTSTYKEFLSCFVLQKESDYILLKSDTPSEKLDNLAADIFKIIFKMRDIGMLSDFVKVSNIDPKDVVKLLILHLMNIPFVELSIELIEKFIWVLYCLCSVTEEATNICYNEMSPWWQGIRDMLVDMPCPLRSMIVAMACKAVSRIFEHRFRDKDEVAWESVTAEDAKWGLLIGKLEDISILSIILMFNDVYNGRPFARVHNQEFNINLKYIYTRGKGSITELIAKWLCSMGVPPEAVIAHDLVEENNSLAGLGENAEESEDLFIERQIVNDNPKIFKWLTLLRRQFPLSTVPNYVISNMCWEYAVHWHKNMQNMVELTAVIDCLKNISDVHLQLGLFSIIWSTYIKQTFEACCRLVNKVGKLPADPLCLQDIGFNNKKMVNFLEVTTDYLENFMHFASLPNNVEKSLVRYEKIWDESMPSLVEVAQDTKKVNTDILNLNYQTLCTVYYQSHFSIKYSKPLDSLFDIDYQYIFEALTGNVPQRQISLVASDKLRNPRLKFLTKLIRASIDTITSNENVTYNEECTTWINKIIVLANLWNIDADFVKRQQVIGLYHMGYDMLAENVIGDLEEPDSVLPALVAITTQRLKRNLEHSSNPAEWIVSVPPQVYKRLQNTILDNSIPAHPSLVTTAMVLRKLLYQLSKKNKESPANALDIKITEMFIQSCSVLKNI